MKLPAWLPAIAGRVSSLLPKFPPPQESTSQPPSEVSETSRPDELPPSAPAPVVSRVPRPDYRAAQRETEARSRMAYVPRSNPKAPGLLHLPGRRTFLQLEAHTVAERRVVRDADGKPKLLPGGEPVVESVEVERFTHRNISKFKGSKKERRRARAARRALEAMPVESIQESIAEAAAD